VRRTTGIRWSELRRAGLAFALLRFRDRCRLRVVGTRMAAAWRARRAVVGNAVGLHSPGPAASDRAVRPVTPRHPVGVRAARLAMDGYPFDVAFFRPGVAAITRAHVATVDCIALDPPRVVASIRAGCVPTRIVCTRSGDRAYVTNQFTEEISVLDLATGRQVRRIPVPGNPMGALLTADGHTLYVTTNVDRLSRLWLPTEGVVASAALPLACAHLALHPSGHRLYVPTWRAGMILELDAHSLRTHRTFTVGGYVQDVVVSADGLKLYAANEGGWLDVIHLTTGRRERTIPLGSPAFGLALSPDQAQLYVGLFHAGQVTILDTRCLRAIGALETGGRPRRIAFDPSGSTALVANEAGWVDIIR
jgi:YVTN family beta-propeller protein